MKVLFGTPDYNKNQKQWKCKKINVNVSVVDDDGIKRRMAVMGEYDTMTINEIKMF